MNIHFKDKKLFQSLKTRIFLKLEVGSSLYGLDNNNSDTDYLYVYQESQEELLSLNWTGHQFQYKEDSIDHNFTGLRTFIRNILNGDSTINFEVLYSDEFKKSSLEWLSKYDFGNYNIIRSYLGLAKRDLKYLKNDTKQLKYFSDKDYKKATHFLRGIEFAKRILDKNFSLDCSDLVSIKSGLESNLKEMILEKEVEMNELRISLNKMLDAKQIVKYMDVDSLLALNEELIKKSLVIRSDLNVSDLAIKTIEEGVIYD